MISLEKANDADCEAIHRMQVQAFQLLLDRYKDYDTNPASESLERVRERMAQSFTNYYLLRLDGTDIGALRIVRFTDGTRRISPMFVLPQYQDNGYAQEAIRQAEALYPEAVRWELDTIRQEKKLCRLYEKMGYVLTGKEKELNENMTLVGYAK